MEKKVKVFVIYLDEVFSSVHPCSFLHEHPISFLMERNFYRNGRVIMAEYVDGARTRIVEVIDGEYYERCE